MQLNKLVLPGVKWGGRKPFPSALPSASLALLLPYCTNWPVLPGMWEDAEVHEKLTHHICQGSHVQPAQPLPGKAGLRE